MPRRLILSGEQHWFQGIIFLTCPVLPLHQYIFSLPGPPTRFFVLTIFHLCDLGLRAFSFAFGYVSILICICISLVVALPSHP